MRHLILSLLALLWVTSSWAYTFTTSNGREINVTAVTKDIIKISNILPGETVPLAHWGEPAATGKFKVSKSKDGSVTLTTTSGVKITILPSGALDIFNKREKEPIIRDSGERKTTCGKQKIELFTADNLHFYGAGERGYSFNIAGDTMVMYNKQNYGYTAGEKRIKQMGICMPLFISSSGFAVAFDDYAAAEMIMSNPVVYETEGKAPVSYYYINGAGTLNDATKQLSYLTGRQPLAPFWSLGYITSKYGYKTQQEAVGTIDTLRREGYPVDGIVLDLYWYGKEQDMGRLAWDKEQWPNHKKMLADFKDQGVHLIPISQPYLLRNGRGVDNYNELSSKGMLVADTTGKPLEVKIWVGEGGMFDMSNPSTRSWLTRRYHDLTQDGVAGWWGDLGEPEVHPDSALHFNGLRTREYHNLYGNDWSKLIHDMYKTEYPDQRVMTMMRAGTTGLGKYGVFPWSTDVSRSWGGLKPQVNIMLNSGLSGLGYMSSDIGGFAIDDNHPYDPELYVRWLQLGTFSPILRTHAQRTAEPYNYPEQKDIILELVKDRYRWLPYNYSLAFENALYGTPLARPLNFYSGESKYDDITDEYLWGRDLLIAPVMEPGAKERRIVFPQGTWLDAQNPSKKYQEGDTISYPTPLEVLPQFVRAGAFLPLAPYEMKNTGDYRPDDYLINYYPVKGVKSETVLYEDDRQNPRSIENGQFSKITFSGNDQKGNINIEVSNEGTYPGAPATKKLIFRIHNVPEMKQIKVNGKIANPKAVTYDSLHRILELKAAWEVAGKLKINLKP